MTTRRGRGRPPGEGNTREAVLAAARRIFTERGYDRASLRLIAAAAGVDPGMVRHFFGDKEGLFRAALAIPFDPAEVIPPLLGPGLDGLGERLVRFFLGIWENDTAPFAAILRGATNHEQSAAMLREFAVEAVIGRVATAIDRPEPRLRATLVASQLMGIGLLRHILRIEPLASAPTETLVTALAPTVQRYLAEDIWPDAR